MPERPDPTVLVLFGATGDLARRMVLPALFRLAGQGLLPQDWRLVGSSRRDGSDDQFRDRVREALEEFGPELDDDLWQEFSGRLRFAGGGFTPDDPGQLLDVVRAAEDDLGGTAQRVFYLAVPPEGFEGYTRAIDRHGLAERSRVVYEKPFGTSMESFRDLDRAVHEVLSESQVFRIDHFLGKEATQQLHVVRFTNRLLAQAWNAEHVESVQVDVPETLDVADRAEFYDATGAVLDMLVTHLFQVAAEVAMEPPASPAADDLAAAREAVIGEFRALSPDDVVLGQYDGYRDLPEVADDSATDTFVAARLWIDNDRWRGVPFLLRTGKQLAESRQQITITFRAPEQPVYGEAVGPSALVFDLKGDGRIGLSLVAKVPGPELALAPVTAQLPLGDAFEADVLPPYARLLHDVLTGDRTLFTRPDGLQEVWDAAAPLLADRPQPLPYPPGSWGPAEADRLAEPWRWRLGPAETGR